MRDFLLFTLWGPLAAAGEVAVGERRTGWDRPGRSAVLGLVAAALGIERQDEAAQTALDAGYGYAVRVEAEGVLLEDYHTAQVPPARKGRRWPTRRAELAEPGLETILSLRDYRADARHTVALWAREEPPHGPWSVSPRRCAGPASPSTSGGAPAPWACRPRPGS